VGWSGCARCDRARCCNGLAPFGRVRIDPVRDVPQRSTAAATVLSGIVGVSRAAVGVTRAEGADGASEDNVGAGLDRLFLCACVPRGRSVGLRVNPTYLLGLVLNP